MKYHRIGLALVGTFCVLALGARTNYSQEKAASSTVQVHMVITDQALNDTDEVAVLRAEDIRVAQNRNTLKVDQLIPAREPNAALQLFIVIDETCVPQAIGNNLTELREFINLQPKSTVIGVAYMSNATVQIVQNFTADHALAAQAIRLPRGTLSAMDSPYLSLISLVTGWPQQNVRREVLVMTDGIDRLRGERPSAASSSMARSPGRGPQPSINNFTTMPTISIDADRASTQSQRAGVIVHSIYSTGVGRLGRNSWEVQLGQAGMAKIADETGGEYFALGTREPVSFKPFLDRLQRILDNQYFLVFRAIPQRNDGLQRVRITTELPNFEIAAANNVWVPAAK
jgi:hypothetical protein